MPQAHALPRKVALAAGGTGGHMFPAEALARELIARGVGVALITDTRGGGKSGSANAPTGIVTKPGIASGQ